MKLDKATASQTNMISPSTESRRRTLYHHSKRLINRAAILLIDLYRLLLSPFLGGQCRFHPSCSAYAREVFELHAPHRAAFLSIRRLSRCHPFNPGGYDPAPAPYDNNEEKDL